MFREFQKTKTWANCPIRFVCNEGSDASIMLGVMQRQLLEYYTIKEFGKTETKSEIIKRIAKEKGIKVFDIPLTSFS